MSSNPPPFGRVVSEASIGDQSPKIITFYKDLVNEVDVHFMRALGNNNIATTDPIATSAEAYDENNGDYLLQTSNTSVVIREKDSPSTSIDKNEIKIIKSSPPNTSRDNDCNSKETNLLQNRPNGGSDDVKVVHTGPAIIYPDLASYLVHPSVDSFSDAPRIHGQPSSPPIMTTNSSSMMNDHYMIQQQSHSPSGVVGNTLQFRTPSMLPSSHTAALPTYHDNHHLAFSTNFATSTNYHQPIHSVHNNCNGMDFVSQPHHLTHQSSYSYDPPHYNDYDQYISTSNTWPPPLSHKPIHYDTPPLVHHCSATNGGTTDYNTATQWASYHPPHPPSYHPTDHRLLGTDSELHHILKL